MRKKWMKEFANKPPARLLEGVIHVYCEPCMPGCCADNGNKCVLDGFFVNHNVGEDVPKQRFEFVGVAHKATVLVYLGIISEQDALNIAKKQARYWR